MQNFRNPLFTKGRVLKKESLDHLYGFPKELAQLAFGTWSDGILYGFGITCREDRITVAAGALHYQGEVIVLQEDSLPFSEYEAMVSVKLCLGEKYLTQDDEVIPVEVKADTRLSPDRNELELGRFCLSRGAVLRSSYKDVEDFKTPHNTLDLTNVPYAGEDRPTLSPRLLRLFGESLLHLGAGSSLDETFGFLCMNSSVVHRSCILSYLSCRLKEPYGELSNGEIWERLVRILGRGPAKTQTKGFGGRKGPDIM